VIVEHYAAVETQLKAGVNLSSKVFDTARRDASGALIRDTYLVLFGGAPDTLTSGRFTLPQQGDSDADFVYTVRAVSVTPDGVRAILSAACTQLIGAVVTAEGRRPSRIRLTLAHEVQSDDSIQPPLYFSDTEFTLSTVKA
jgi:hypothetical protein